MGGGAQSRLDDHRRRQRAALRVGLDTQQAWNFFRGIFPKALVFRGGLSHPSSTVPRMQSVLEPPAAPTMAEGAAAWSQLSAALDEQARLQARIVALAGR